MSRKERRTTLEVKTQEEKTTKKHNKKSKEVSLFTILFVTLFIAVLIGIYLGVRHLVITLKYKSYTDKMVAYGYNELYDNNKATATDKVTKAELIKVIIGSIENNKDIYSLYYLADRDVSEANNWLAYANYLGVNNDIAIGELEKSATTNDAIMMLIKVVESVEGLELSKTQLKMSESKLSALTKDEQDLIAKAVTLGIIKNKNSALANNDILKGGLNKLVITVAETYATMHYDTTIVNQNGDVIRQDISIVTDKDKMPENYKEYPYIVDNIEKDAYEWEYKVRTSRTFKNPKQTYKAMGYLYGQTADLIVRYFNTILNVDYSNITTNNFLESITNDVAYKLDEQDVKQYVDYVKNNKIKLQGSAKPLLPIMYNNGEQYVVRTKLSFKVLNSDTNYNLLFGDENYTVKYDSKQITMYVDVPLGTTLNSNSQLVYVDCLAQYIANNNAMVVLEK